MNELRDERVDRWAQGRMRIPWVFRGDLKRVAAWFESRFAVPRYSELKIDSLSGQVHGKVALNYLKPKFTCFYVALSTHSQIIGNGLAIDGPCRSDTLTIREPNSNE